jgi:hypothetical protein
MKMDKIQERKIKQDILLKKKQGMQEKDIIKFLKLSGYPLRLLEEVNSEIREEIKEDSGPSMLPKILGVLFIVSAVIEISYFFTLNPEALSVKFGLEFIPLALLVLFTVLSFSLGYALFKSKSWGYTYGFILLFLRIILLVYLAFTNNVFFGLIVVLDLITELVLGLSRPLFIGIKPKNETEKLMEEVEAHRFGKDKKEVWQD